MRLARYGGRLALVARRGDLLAEVARQVARPAATRWRWSADVTDLASVREVHARLRAEQGPVDVAFLNAGVGAPTSLRRFDADGVRRIFEVNVFGVANWLEVLLPDMLERQRGVIAGTSSLAAARGIPGSGAYAASKAAMSYLLESLRPEARLHGIQITTIEPGFVRTPLSSKNQFPMPFLMEVEPAAELICKQVAQGRRVIRFPRAMAAVSGLLGALPASVFDSLGASLIARQRPRQRAGQR